MRSKTKSVNTVIALSITTTILLTFAVGIWWISSSTYSAILKQQEATMNIMVKESMNALKTYIAQSRSIADLLAHDSAMIQAIQGGEPEQAQATFAALMKTYPGMWAAFVFNKEGKVVAGLNAKGTVMAGADRSTRGYVKAVLSGKDKYLSNNILLAKSGNCFIFAVANAVKDANGKTIGGIGLFPNWEYFTKTFVDPVHIGEHGYGFMLDGKGLFIAHGADKDLLLKDVSDQDFVKTALAEKKGLEHYSWEGRKKIMAFDSFAETGWIMAMSAYEDDLASTAISQRYALTAGGLAAALLLLGIIIFLVRKNIIKPTQHILDFATKIADGDFSAELEGNYKYELALLADKINIMVGELKTKLGFSDGVLKALPLPCILIGPDFKLLWTNDQMCSLLEKTQGPKAHVGQTSGEFVYNDPSRQALADQAIKEQRRIDAEVEYTAPSGASHNIQIISTPFFDMDGQLLGSLAVWIDVTDIRKQQALISEQNERIAGAAMQAEEISQHVSAAADELSAQIDEAAKGAHTQQDRASETATAMNQMNATVLEVAQNASSAAEGADEARAKAEDGSAIVDKVISSISDVRGHSENLKSSMQELGNQAENIGQILNVISDIADQTNLLALNAAIEAARAGEAGRGFAVVADEVRKLAEKTMTATKEVDAAIAGMQAATSDNIKATDLAAESVSETTELADQSGEVLREILGIMEKAADQVRGIATAAEEQSATSEQITRATDEINAISNETAQVMGESSQAVRDVAEMAVKLNQVMEDMSGDETPKALDA